MANNSLNQVVLQALEQASGPSRTGALPDLSQVTGQAFSSAVTEASRQINALTSTSQALIDTVLSNTQAVIQNSATQSSGSAASKAGGVISTLLGSGLGLVPLVSSLAHLFGGDSPAPQPLLQYVAPPSLQLDLANGPGLVAGLSSFSPLTYGQNGLPQSAPRQATAAPSATAAPQISIHVSAMDSRSFLDHSYEIAQAVRAAMLDSHSLNDVVNDL